MNSILKRFNFIFSALFFLIIVSYTIGLDILFFPPGSFNPDTYSHIAVANYMVSNHFSLRDVHTVGPVIPLLIASIKYFLSLFSSWHIYYDEIIVKCLSFFCFFVISLTLFSNLKDSRFSTFSALIVLFVFLSIFPTQMDVISLNGEIMSVSVISLILFFRNKNFEYKHVFFAFLLLICLYIKIQSILLIFLILLLFINDLIFLRKLIYSLLIIFIGCELILINFDIGLYANFMKYISYINTGHNTPSEGNLIDVFRWEVYYGNYFYPFFIFIFIVAFFDIKSFKKTNENIFLWLTITLLTIAIPHRKFDHYILYYIPFLILFLPKALASFKFYARKPPTTLLIVSLFSVFLVASKSYIMIKKFSFVTDDLPYIEKYVGPEARDIFTVVCSRNSKLFVHGWDYRFYTFFNKPDSGSEVPSLFLNEIDKTQYQNKLVMYNPDFIIDLTSYSGLWKSPSFKFNSFITDINFINSYKVIYNQNGLVLYKRV